VTVTQQFTSNPKIVAVVGPVGSQQVEAVGPLMARAGMAFISGSVTAVALTTGKYPTSSGPCPRTACRDRRTPTTS
jgi:ABC-type branched-subunit amino acid transport system substrate-binding protein